MVVRGKEIHFSIDEKISWTCRKIFRMVIVTPMQNLSRIFSMCVNLVLDTLKLQQNCFRMNIYIVASLYI